jgi:carbonic anhydrase
MPIRTLAAALAAILLGQVVQGADQTHPSLSPSAAQARLRAGNSRFVAGNLEHPNQSPARRAKLAEGQYPFAVILGCADSRTAPEVVFDQGLGDLFVVRTAGNVVDDIALGSIEYAVEHLGASLIVVLGHENCGAVKATLDGSKLPGHLPAIAKAIRPAVKASAHRPGDPLDNAVMENAVLEANRIRASKPILRKLIEEGRVRVVPARYDLDSGHVSFLASRKY